MTKNDLLGLVVQEVAAGKEAFCVCLKIQFSPCVHPVCNRLVTVISSSSVKVPGP
jgi:hypothetical protein